jgi:hypothetical protein
MRQLCYFPELREFEDASKISTCNMGLLRKQLGRRFFCGRFFRKLRLKMSIDN